MDDLTLYEHWLTIKRVMHYYRQPILVAMVALLAIFGGSYYYNSYVQNQQMAASKYFDTLVSLYEKDTEQFLSLSDDLIKRYPKTVYGQMIPLVTGATYAKQSDFEKAKQQFVQGLSKTKDIFLQDCYRYQLARLSLVLADDVAAYDYLNAISESNNLMKQYALLSYYRVHKEWDKAQEALELLLAEDNILLKQGDFYDWIDLLAADLS